MACWDEFLTDRDRAVFAKSGYGHRQGFGRSPALLVVDVTYAFVGDHSEPILRAVERPALHHRRGVRRSMKPL